MKTGGSCGWRMRELRADGGGGDRTYPSTLSCDADRRPFSPAVTVAPRVDGQLYPGALRPGDQTGAVLIFERCQAPACASEVINATASRTLRRPPARRRTLCCPSEGAFRWSSANAVHSASTAVAARRQPRSSLHISLKLCLPLTGSRLRDWTAIDRLRGKPPLRSSTSVSSCFRRHGAGERRDLRDHRLRALEHLRVLCPGERVVMRVSASSMAGLLLLGA